MALETLKEGLSVKGTITWVKACDMAQIKANIRPLSEYLYKYPQKLG